MTNKNQHTVLSASRMTDMPAFYPSEIINEVQKRLAKNVKIHTLVLWTKHPASLLKNPLFTFLQELKTLNIQLYIQLTISGLGRRVVGIDNQNQPLILEPHVPETSQAIALLPEVIKLAGNPYRIKLRIDPIVRLIDYKGDTFSSFAYFEPIIDKCSKYGIQNYTFSLLEKEAYKKVNNRFLKRGLEIVSPTLAERSHIRDYINNLEEKYRVSIAACCVQGFPESSCIDGTQLEKLSNHLSTLSPKKPYSRPLCGCTASIDIGGWPPKKCYSGCIYCYANPQIAQNTNKQ